MFDTIPPENVPVIDIRGLGPVHYRKNPQWVKFEQYERGGKSEGSFWNRTRRTFKHESTWLRLVPDREAVGAPVSPVAQKFGQQSQRALDKLTDGEYRAVSELLLHPRYSEIASDFDLAALWLDGPVSATPVALHREPLDSSWVGQRLRVERPFHRRRGQDITWRRPLAADGRLLRDFGPYKNDHGVVMPRTEQVFPPKVR